MRCSSHWQLCALLALLCAPLCCTALTVSEVQTMQTQITGLINRTSQLNSQGTLKYPMIPAFVRLSFHDCNSPAGCDGCLNLNITSNKGLEAAVTNLESLYNNASLGIKAKITRADFWALAGLVAINYGAKLQKPPGPGKPVYIPTSLTPTSAFRTGRKDCAKAPTGNETDASFPDGLKGQIDTFAFFQNSYNFTAAEATAILGAHTLGKASVSNSGFQGPWVPGDNILSNAYYRDLSNATAGWAQTKLTQPGGKTQWQRNVPVSPSPPSGPTTMMLNADMGLYKNLTLNSTGGCKCTYSSCPLNTANYLNVQKYADNNTKWLDDFGAVFAKMQSVCGRTAPGVVVPCKLTPLSTAAAATAAVATMGDAEGAAAVEPPVGSVQTTDAAGAVGAVTAAAAVVDADAGATAVAASVPQADATVVPAAAAVDAGAAAAAVPMVGAASVAAGPTEAVAAQAAVVADMEPIGVGAGRRMRKLV